MLGLLLYYSGLMDESELFRRGTINSAPISCSGMGKIALTFDDGPGLQTNNVIKALRDNGLKATFHVVTEYYKDPVVQANIRNAHQNNFMIGIRFPTKQDPTQMAAEDIEAALADSSAVIQDIIQQPPVFVRLPYGAHKNVTLIKLIQSLGYIVTGTNMDAGDYIQGANGISVVKVYSDFFSQIANGTGSAIVLHHDTSNIYSDPMVIKNIANLMKQYGYTSVALDECVGGSNGGTNNNNNNNNNNNVNMEDYYNCGGGGCFDGDCEVKLANG